MTKPVYLVAGSKSWNRNVFDDTLCHLPGKWHFLDSREALTLKAVREIAPIYIFFLHWSWKVPREIVRNFECVCFHMTDVPYGRGGSPLQNLILRGHRETMLTALRMCDELDAGPVYLKEILSLDGSAEEILIKACRLSARMIEVLINENIQPKPQTGDVTVFKRRKPAESRIPPLSSVNGLYDFIRMLDAEGYPKAFLVQEGYRYEFSGAQLCDGHIVADVTIIPAKEENA